MLAALCLMQSKDLEPLNTTAGQKAKETKASSKFSKVKVKWETGSYLTEMTSRAREMQSQQGECNLQGSHGTIIVPKTWGRSFKIGCHYKLCFTFLLQQKYFINKMKYSKCGDYLFLGNKHERYICSVGQMGCNRFQPCTHPKSFEGDPMSISLSQGHFKVYTKAGWKRCS